MDILEEILTTLPPNPVPVRNVTVGIHWTAVCSAFCGLASTLTSENLPYANIGEVGTLHLKPAQELARLVLSENHYESSVGMAALNSLIQPKPEDCMELNAYDWLFSNCPGKDVAIVGHFNFVDQVRILARNLWVLEKNPRPGDIPAEYSAEYLGKAEIIAITGSAFVNHSMSDVLAMCNPKATIMILGPSTPLSPVLFDHNVSILSGARVVDETGALLTIQQGGGFSQVWGVKRVTLFRKGIRA
jgi:uncharacterized protein (DUF4213/DUF364 family)